MACPDSDSYYGGMNEAHSNVIISVVSFRPVHRGRLLALADVELVIDGIQIRVHGVQVVADGNGTQVTLPKFRDADGEWRTAVTLPPEVKGPMGDVVLAAGLEAGVLRERFAAER